MEGRTSNAKERKIDTEESNPTAEQLLQQKIVELESKIVEMDKEIVSLKKKSTNYDDESILDLPNEILWKIMGYLSNHDILRNVAQVSKKFQKLTQDPFLIRKINVDLGYSPSWRRQLTEQQKEKYCNDLLEVWKRSRGLTSFELDLSGDSQTYLLPKIEEALPSLDHPVLEELELRFWSNTFFPGDFFLKNALKYLHQCPRLKKVELPLPQQYHYSTISKFISGFEHNNLSELILYDDSDIIMDLEMSSFKKSLETIVGNLPKLQYLHLGFFKLGEEFHKEFRQIVEKISSEKKVQIEFFFD